MKEIRLHGRGGQGAVMASQMIVNAYVIEGGYGNAIPFFGFERRGAPTSAFVRLDNKPIREKTQVYSPDCVIVVDPTLRATVNVFNGLKGDGIAVLNERRPVNPAELPESVKKLGYVDATRIAVDILGAPITNTPMLGAFAAVTGWVKLDSILQSFELFLSPKVIEKNIAAARLAYETVQVRELARR